MSSIPVIPVTAPPLCLDHLDKLTDDKGIVQFARFGEPDLSSGYCVDDVARLAIVAAELQGQRRGGELARRWARQSVDYLTDAAGSDGPSEAALHNLSDGSGAWIDEPHRGDHVGRAMWGLGVVASTDEVATETRRAARELLDALAPATMRLAEAGLRSVVYALLGLSRRAAVGPELAAAVAHLDERLRTDSRADWLWFEPMLSYDNARLPQAMLAGAIRLGDAAAAGRALAALDWYVDRVRVASGHLRCVGNEWRYRDHAPASGGGSDHDGDEQPIDAGAITEALADAWVYTNDSRYAELAGRAYAWFLGHNRVGERLYTATNGGCRDGLGPAGVNANQGAESTLAYHQALLRMVRCGLVALPTATGSPSGDARSTSAPLHTEGHTGAH